MGFPFDDLPSATRSGKVVDGKRGGGGARLHVGDRAPVAGMRRGVEESAPGEHGVPNMRSDAVDAAVGELDASTAMASGGNAISLVLALGCEDR